MGRMEKTFSKSYRIIQVLGTALLALSFIIWWGLGSLGIENAYIYSLYIFGGGMVLVIIFCFFIPMFKAQVGEIQSVRKREEEKRQHPQQISITDVTTGITEGAGKCPLCGQPMAYISQYGKYYCYNCKQYLT